MLNLETGAKIPLLGRDDEFLESFSVSPDSHWLAYTSMRTKETWTDRLVIMGASGKPVKDRLISTREWVYLDGWLDNQNLVFEKYDPVNFSRYGGPVSTVIYNPFTTEQKQVDPNYPDISNNGVRISGWPYTETVYNSSLTLVAYPLNDRTIVLWDRTNNKELVRFSKSLSSDYGSVPVWSPDGSLMLKLNPSSDNSSQSELFSINGSGTFTQLTHLSNSHIETWIFFYSWSPDMQRIAFWLSGGSNPDPHGFRLAVLDLETKTVTDYCVKEGSMSQLTHYVFA